MKRDLIFTFLSLLLMSSVTFANQSILSGLKKSTFDPVPWHATFENGGFALQNQTEKTQYVQIIIKKGEIDVYAFGNGSEKCRAHLDAQYSPISVVCELAPNDILNGNIDLVRRQEATGTYQVEMSQ